MMRALLEERIQQMKGAQGSEFSDDIRRLLRTRLTSNRCSADDIADLLAMHRRTLSRRLKGGGMGYRAITNEIRFEIARQLLEDTQVPLGSDRGGPRLFRGQRLHPGLPALVGPDADSLAGRRPSWVTRRRPKLSRDCPLRSSAMPRLAYSDPAGGR